MITLPAPAVLSESKIEEKINEIKSKFQKRKKAEELQDDANLSQNALERIAQTTAISLMGLIPKEEIERYNNEVENYIPAYTNFIARGLEFENQKRRTIRLDIALANDGTLLA